MRKNSGFIGVSDRALAAIIIILIAMIVVVFLPTGENASAGGPALKAADDATDSPMTDAERFGKALKKKGKTELPEIEGPIVKPELTPHMKKVYEEKKKKDEMREKRKDNNGRSKDEPAAY